MINWLKRYILSSKRQSENKDLCEDINKKKNLKLIKLSPILNQHLKSYGRKCGLILVCRIQEVCMTYWITGQTVGKDRSNKLSNPRNKIKKHVKYQSHTIAENICINFKKDLLKSV